MRLGLGKAAVGDVLEEDAEVDREAIHHRDADAGANGEAEAEVLTLGVGGARGVGEHEADAGLEVRDHGPTFLDKVVAGAEEAAGEPGIRAVDDRGIHAAEEELGVAAGPVVVTNLVQLPSHGDELGEVAVVVGVPDGEKAGGFGGKGDHILAKHGRAGFRCVLL